MKQHRAFVGNAPRPTVRAAWSVCAYDNCNADPNEELAAPLCMEHAKKVAVQVMLLTNTSVNPTMKGIGGKATAKKLAAPYSPQPRDRAGVVYFIQFGDRIKIGFTSDLKRRMQVLPHDKVLAVIAGTMTDERRCHEKFAHLRLTGEWFSAGPELLKFINKLPVHETLAA